MMDSFGLHHQIALSPISRFIDEILKYPFVTGVNISDHVDFDNSGFFGIKVTGWSEEYQQGYYCILGRIHEAVLADKTGFDMMLNGIFYTIDQLLESGPSSA